MPEVYQLRRSLEVVWQYDGPGGFEWRARDGGERAVGRADTDDDAWNAGLAWLTERG